MKKQGDEEENRNFSSLGTQLSLLGGPLIFYPLIFPSIGPTLPIILVVCLGHHSETICWKEVPG